MVATSANKPKLPPLSGAAFALRSKPERGVALVELASAEGDDFWAVE